MSILNDIPQSYISGSIFAKPGLCPGCDGLSSNLAKACFPTLKLHLLYIACFSLEFFPASWKTAKVLVTENQTNRRTNNLSQPFRPISLVYTFAKILEKAILNRLQWHANAYNWISSNQHGFTDGCSTDSACHSLVDFIDVGFEGKQTACAFLDIKSAFDTAGHPAILAALLNSHLGHWNSGDIISQIPLALSWKLFLVLG